MSKSKKNSKPVTEVLISKEVYGEAPQKDHFVLSNGNKLKDLKELTQSLERMPDEIFRHHVNPIKNDFSSWVKDVFNENSLADDLKNLHSKVETELALQRHINARLEKLIKRLVKK